MLPLRRPHGTTSSTTLATTLLPSSSLASSARSIPSTPGAFERWQILHELVEDAHDPNLMRYAALGIGGTPSLASRGGSHGRREALARMGGEGTCGSLGSPSTRPETPPVGAGEAIPVVLEGIFGGLSSLPRT